MVFSRILLSIVFVVTSVISLNANAYKINTHIWVGAQVVEDLSDDGKVTIEPFGDFSVDADIVSAITQNPKAYLYGNVGPDFFPDVMAGQMVVHPGREEIEKGVLAKGWNSDEWFKYLLKDRAGMKGNELAFSMGYLAHGAADFWAHTYVNTYAGNIFSLTDDDMLEAEIRHYLLEGYIDHYTPSVVRNSGVTVGSGIDVLNAYPGEMPYQYMVDKLMFNREIRDMYWKGAPHLAAASVIKNELPKWIDFVNGERNVLYKIIGDVIEDNIGILEDALQDETKWNEKMCNYIDETALGNFRYQYGQTIVENTTQINLAVDNFVESTRRDRDQDTQRFHDELFAVSDKFEEVRGQSIQSLKRNIESLEVSIANTATSLAQEAVNLNSSINSKQCSILEKVITSTEGVHEYLADQLPFDNTTNEMLVAGIYPGGILGLPTPGNILDGLFGNDDPPPMPTIKIETGDKAYFLQKIAIHKYEIDRLYEERKGVLPYHEPDRYELLTNMIKYNQTEYTKYTAAIVDLPDGMQTTVITSSNGSTGQSNKNAAWLCNEINGFVDSALSSAVNNVDSLTRQHLSLKGDLIGVAESLRAELHAAAKELITVPYQVNLMAVNAVDSMMIKAKEINRLAGSAAELEAGIANDVNNFMADICSDIYAVKAFFDNGTVEGAPYVAAYFIDYYAKQYGVTDEDDDSDLYTEWLYYFMRDWQRGVDQAAYAYEETQREVVDILLDPNKGMNHVQDKIGDWFVCQGPKYLGMSPFTASVMCAADANMEDLHQTLSDLQKDHDEFIKKYMMVGVPEKLKITKTEIDKARDDLVASLTRRAIAKSEELQLLEYMIKGNKNDPYEMDLYFSDSNVKYLEFDRFEDPFSERAKADMALKNGKLDPNRFAPIYNSVVLSKLTLLNASELNRLVSISGGHSNIYGSLLFQETSDEPFNILFGAVRTIDGDHQWLEEPPRHIRVDASDSGVLGNLSYSMFDSSGQKGFKLYQDPKVRKNVFEKIFIGPLNGAIQVPYKHNLKNIVPSAYPYQPCDFHPYPNGENDRICMISWLIPVLSVLN